MSQIDNLRRFFPVPHPLSMARANFHGLFEMYLDRIDTLQSVTGYMGELPETDYSRIWGNKFPERGSSDKEVLEYLLTFVQGTFDWCSAKNMVAAVPPPTLVSLLAHLITNRFAPNLAWDTYSYGFARAEVEAISMLSDLLGYEPGSAAGVFTYGGAGTLLYGIKIGLEKAAPETFRQGLNARSKIFASEVSHFSKYIATGWLGIGSDNVVPIQSDHNTISTADLACKLSEAICDGYRIAAIIAEVGTTYEFAMDDVLEIVRVRDQIAETYDLSYKPHVHADAVLGWIFLVFQGYDFETNPLGLSNEALSNIAYLAKRTECLRLADSVGLDFHKLGYTPLISSLFLVKRREDLHLIAQDQEKIERMFLNYGCYQPGAFTLECSRSAGGALSALGNILLFGRQGLRVLYGHLIEMSLLLRSGLKRNQFCRILNEECRGPAVVFRFYPVVKGCTDLTAFELTNPHSEKFTARVNAINRTIFQMMDEEVKLGRAGNLSFSDHYRQTVHSRPEAAHIAAFKSYMVSPWTTQDDVERTITSLTRIVDRVMSEHFPSPLSFDALME